jgi:succinyl-diaminopimelate desuccinylase
VVTADGVPPAGAVTPGERLARRTLEMVDVASESRHEAALLERLTAELPVPVAEHADAVRLMVGERRPGTALVVLAGHVDTVPPQANLPGRIERDTEGAQVVGLGASDMKGGLAVMAELAERTAGEPDVFGVDVGFLLFGREELPIAESALRPFLAGSELARQIDLAIVLEPTDNALEIGCLGNLNARVTFRGESAHSARPWLGRNAIHAAVHGLREIAASSPRDVTVDGLTYREVVSVTTIEGGRGGNVVPDEVSAHVNLRYAPGRGPADAEEELRRLVASPHAAIEVLGNAPPGPVSLANPVAQRLRRTGELPVRAKQAWTPVAEFAEVGIDAVNFGPGDPATAHRTDERVRVAALVRCYDVLMATLSGRWR